MLWIANSTTGGSTRNNFANVPMSRARSNWNIPNPASTSAASGSFNKYATPK